MAQILLIMSYTFTSDKPTWNDFFWGGGFFLLMDTQYPDHSTSTRDS